MNPYTIKEPTVISFSGGRSSAYMLRQTLEANGGLPDGSKVIFANTGKEMPETLDFVEECSQQWSVPITWVELGDIEYKGVYEKGRHKGKSIKRYHTAIVDHATASRNGEPFRRLILDRKMPPNMMMRFCTSELKVKRLLDVSADCTTHFVGIRSDEKRRAVKLHNRQEDGKHARLTWCPMYLDGTSAQDVGKFWAASPFDLRLANDNGVTPLGNCDLCFLKGTKKRISIARQRPELVKWWIDIEDEVSRENNRRSQFNKDISYREIAEIVANESQSFDFGDESFACYCGD